MREKGYRGVAMEGNVARWYAKGARRQLDETRALARRLAEHAPAGSALLEIAPGPGHLAIELAKLRNYRITGLDISETFVSMARENAAREGVEIDFRLGDAAGMPFEDASFDFVLCRSAFQNFSKPVRALAEVRRVLRAGGTAVVIDLRKEVSGGEINAHVKRISSGVIHWLTNQLIFRAVLVPRAYAREPLRKMIEESGLREVDIREGPMFREVWLVKGAAPRR